MDPKMGPGHALIGSRQQCNDHSENLKISFFVFPSKFHYEKLVIVNLDQLSYEIFEINVISIILDSLIGPLIVTAGGLTRTWPVPRLN